MSDPQTSFATVPDSKALPRSRTRASLVWLIPILAALVGVWVAVTRILSEGPKITIVFQTAEGMEAGKTKIRFNGVEVGTVVDIRLTLDHQRVLATAQMAPKTESFLVSDTQFWVVRPRISGANVTGLGTLISGAYIGVEIGHSKDSRREFVALETPPEISGETAGRFFLLKTSDLGSLDQGTPLYFRRLQVGKVASYAMDQDGKRLTVKVFVKAPYDQYVNPNTRFWHANGIDVSLSAAGLKVQTQSFLSILIGGIAFETPATDPVLPPADSNAQFVLFSDRNQAFEPAARNPQTYELIFKQSVRGLVPGAPVEFRGIPIGEVAEVRAEVDLKTSEFLAPVLIHLDPQRLGVKLEDLKPGGDLAVMRRNLIDRLVAKGARAQLRTANLLTGSVYVAFDFFPDARPTRVDWSQKPVELPTIGGQLEATEASVTEIITKLNRLPLETIGDDLQKTLADLDLTLVSARNTLASARGTLDNTGNLTAADSAQLQQFTNTLQEWGRAGRSIRVLADYLERHPEALLRGKKEETK